MDLAWKQSHRLQKIRQIDSFWKHQDLSGETEPKFEEKEHDVLTAAEKVRIFKRFYVGKALFPTAFCHSLPNFSRCLSVRKFVKIELKIIMTF